MKQLTCEMCGSTDLLKQDGVFVCQTCGTKYSVEEAKKMMIEGTVEVSGTVKIDNTDKIKNYLEMANSAYEADNKSEAESYCNRIIEIDNENYEAWFLKGKAAGWQSTIANIRIEESVQCFSKAVDYAPEDKKDMVKASAAKEFSSLSTSLVTIPCDSFEEYQSQNNADTIIDCANKTKKYALILLNKCGIKPNEYEKTIANLINNAAINAWNKTIKPTYEKDNDNHPTYDAFCTLLNKATLCSTLVKASIDFADDDELNDEIRYENLIKINRYCINSCSWKKEWVKDRWSGQLICNWTKEYTMRDSSIKQRQSENEKYREAAKLCNEKGNKRLKERQQAENEKKIQERKVRFQAYWSEHAEEKRQLESERDTLQTQLKQLQEQYAPYESEIEQWKDKRQSDTPAQEEKKTLTKQISLLINEQSSLGLFKGKEKKALQAQIDELSDRLPAIDESIEAEEKEQIKLCNDKISELEQQSSPIKDKIAAVQKRINEIKTELTKNR